MSMVNRWKAEKKLKKLCFNGKKNPVDFRAELDETFIKKMLPSNVDCKTGQTDKVKSDLLIPEVYAKNRMILYIHGGSFVGGSCAAWRNFCASFAHESSTQIVLPQIRHAPESPFPSGIDDIEVVFNRMCEKTKNIYIVADSSGASLLLGLFMRLSKTKKAFIKGIVLFSPWVDISNNSCAFSLKKNKDAVLTPEVLKECGTLYTYAENLTNPLVSAVYAEKENLIDFPPIFIQVGSKELILNDVKKMVQKLNENGIFCILDEWKNMSHMFMFTEEYSKEVHVAVKKAARFILQNAQRISE